jgi:hypothetical protein
MTPPARSVSVFARIVAAVSIAVALVAACAAPRDSGSPGPAGPDAPLTLAAPDPAAPAPSGPEAPDLRPLLISPAERPVAGFGEPEVGPLGEDAVTGIVARYDSENGDRLLGETIVVLPDPEAAAAATRGAATSTGGQRPGSSSTPVPVGNAGVIITGYQQDGVASTLLLFSQGTAAVAMDFRSPAAEPTPPEVVLEAGARQAARLAATFG